MTNEEFTESIYPCQFSIKVIGENTEKLEKVVVEVISLFGEEIHPNEIAKKLSKNKKYLSITFEIVARSREYIEQIYSELNAQKEVKMVL